MGRNTKYKMQEVENKKPEFGIVEGINAPQKNYSTNIGGAEKPEDNATEGATSGTNLIAENEDILDDEDIRNNKVYNTDEAVLIRDCLAVLQRYKGGVLAGLVNVTEATFVDESAPTINYGSNVRLDCGRGISVNHDNIILMMLDKALAGDGFQFTLTNTGAQGGTIKVWSNIGSWDESTVTWNTKPSAGREIGEIVLTNGGAGETNTATITGLTTEDVENINNYGIRIYNEEGGIGVLSFDSDDAGSGQPQTNVEAGGVSKTRWVKADASDDNYLLKSFAFAKEGVAEDVDCLGQFSGVVSGFTDLSPGDLYYLSDTAGLISTSAGSNSRVVGRAISTTELFILHQTS